MTKWYVLWNVSVHVSPKELERAFALGGATVSVYAPEYTATTVFEDPITRPLYPGYLFIQGDWSGRWEQLLRENVEGSPRFLLDIDTKEPVAVPEDQMDAVRELVQQLNAKEVFIPSETLGIGDSVYILRRPWEHLPGKVVNMRKGLVFVEMPWGEDKSTVIQVPASQIQKILS